MKNQAQQRTGTDQTLSACDLWHKGALHQEKLWDSSGLGISQKSLLGSKEASHGHGAAQREKIAQDLKTKGK